MIDYISTTIFGCKDTINFSHLQLENKSSKFNNETYSIKGYKNMKIVISHNIGSITLKGSIPYYWQGNNFSFSRELFAKAINHICEQTEIDFWQSDLNEFEYGVIMEVPFKPKEYITQHFVKSKEGLAQDERSSDKGRFRWWTDKNVKLKMYDVGYNLKTKLSNSQREELRPMGWDNKKEYIKFEVHYVKPHVSLNKGVAMKLWQLADNDWENIIRKDLLNQYKRLMPNKTITLPNEKKDFCTPNIYAHTLVGLVTSLGFSSDDVKKMLYKTVNDATGILTKSDKDARKAEIRKIQGAISQQSESQWDLTKRILQAIGFSQT